MPASEKIAKIIIPNLEISFSHVLKKYHSKRKVTRTDVFRFRGINNYIYYHPTTVRKIFVVIQPLHVQ